MCQGGGGNDTLHGTARHALFYASVILIIRFFKRKSIYRVHVLKGDAYPAVLRVSDKRFLTQFDAVKRSQSGLVPWSRHTLSQNEDERSFRHTQSVKLKT